eukprot:135816-Hanusia_phi.AAC.1
MTPSEVLNESAPRSDPTGRPAPGRPRVRSPAPGAAVPPPQTVQRRAAANHSQVQSLRRSLAPRGAGHPGPMSRSQ